MHRSRASLQAADLDAKIDEERAVVPELSEEKKGRPDDRGSRDALEDGYEIRALGKKENALALKDAGDAQQPSPAQPLCWRTSMQSKVMRMTRENWCDWELRTRMHRSRTCLQAAGP